MDEGDALVSEAATPQAQKDFDLYIKATLTENVSGRRSVKPKTSGLKSALI
jgi:hypothetical protein